MGEFIGNSTVNSSLTTTQLKVGSNSTFTMLTANATGLYANATLVANSTGPYGKTEANLNVNSATYATSAGSATNATYATSAGSVSGTNLGKTGGQGFFTTTGWGPTNWRDLAIGGGGMAVASTPGAPTTNYGYFIKVGNRDAGGGWGGLWFDYNDGYTAYLGTTTDGTVNATWRQLVTNNSGTWSININGSAASATNASAATNATYATSAGSATNASNVNGNMQGTWNGNITWNAGVNILVGGESSFDLSSGGQWGVWDGATSNMWIRTNYNDHLRLVENGKNCYVYGSRLYNDSGQQAVFNNGGTWSINVNGSAGYVTQTFTGTNAGNLLYAPIADNDFFRLRVGGDATNAGWVEIATADDGTEPIYVRQYTGVFSTVARTATILDGSGNSTFPGNVTAYASDERLKTNFARIVNPIEKIKQLSGYTFDWRSDVCASVGFNPAKIHEHGLKAQEVQKIIEDAVDLAPFDIDTENGGGSRSGQNYLTVKYEKLVPLLIEAIKEQQKQIEELKMNMRG